jgi:hypothetical protein
MSEMGQTDSEIFAGGPPVRLERSLGLIKPDNPRIIQRAILAGLIGWVPLVVLTVAQDSTWWGEKLRSLLLDLAVPARSLIAAPLFIFAESICIPQLGTTVRHFLDAGLKFVGYSLRAFSPLAFALGTIAAGFVANHVVHAGVRPATYIHLIGALVVGVAALFSGPLLIFSGKLLQAKRRGILTYGALANGEGQQFERKWLNRAESLDDSVLEVPDFSATTDLYQVVTNVYEMGIVPLDLKNLIPLVTATLLPFVPVVLMAVPLDVLLQQFAKLLL